MRKGGGSGGPRTRLAAAESALRWRAVPLPAPSRIKRQGASRVRWCVRSCSAATWVHCGATGRSRSRPFARADVLCVRLALAATHDTCCVCFMPAVRYRLCSATAIGRASCTTGARAAGKSATHGCVASSTADSTASQAAPSHAARSADRPIGAPNGRSLHAVPSERCHGACAMCRGRRCQHAQRAQRSAAWRRWCIARPLPARYALQGRLATCCASSAASTFRVNAQLLRSLSTCGACSLESHH